MANHSTQFESTAGGLVLTNAILLYGPEARQTLSASDAPAFASIHAVEDRDGRPVIAAGTPLTRAHLRRWTEALGRAAPPELLPENVLVAHPDMLAWWLPAQVRTAYFALSSPPKGLKTIATRTTVPVPYPAHLLIATRAGLGVYALPESRRPTAETVVLHSPVLNVFLDGDLCWGNVPRPKTIAPASIPDYERAVFDSWSTHLNPGQEMTVNCRNRRKPGLLRLWDDLATRRALHFPVERLEPFDPDPRRKGEPVTLGRLIARKAR